LPVSLLFVIQTALFCLFGLGQIILIPSDSPIVNFALRGTIITRGENQPFLFLGRSFVEYSPTIFRLPLLSVGLEATENCHCKWNQICRTENVSAIFHE
jgi:hypothetical protein